MSLLSRDELRVVFGPDQLILLKARAQRSLLGWQREVVDKRILPCVRQNDDAEPWGATLAALELALPTFTAASARTTIVLSNHFVRYAMIPWSDALSDEQEERAYAEHTFREIYGDEAADWELRISPNRAGKPQMASAVDAQLLHALRELGARHQLVLDSIQPLLMLAYNQSQAALHDKDAWLVIVEQSYLCVMLLRSGQWVWVRTLRSSDAWAQELPALLDREAFLADADVQTQDVFISSPQRAVLPEGTRWHFHYFQPAGLPGLEPERDRHFALYLHG